MKQAIEFIIGLFTKSNTDKKSSDAQLNRDNEIKDIRRGIVSYLENHDKKHDYSKFSSACFDAFVAAINDFRKQGGTIEREREIYFTGNLIRSAEFEGRVDKILGTLDDAIEKTRDKIENETFGRYIGNADLLSRNIINIIDYDLYINDIIVKNACEKSGLCKIINV